MNPILILQDENVPDEVIVHSLAVNKLARGIAYKIGKKQKVDERLVDVGSMLHDIGRCKTHGIQHGVIGAGILRKWRLDEDICLIAERHLFAGISKEEAKKFQLPARNYIPENIEEKIVAYADNQVDGEKVVGSGPKIRRVEQWLGKNHQIVKRMKKLDAEIRTLSR